MLIRKLSRLYHTVRYLKVRQVFYRLYYRFTRVKPQDPGCLTCRSWAARWNAIPWGNLSTEDGEHFTFLGEHGRVSDASDWQAEKYSKLWRYNLHYLDDLSARGIEQRPELAQKLIEKWVSANPPVSGEGWEPYPLSLRIVNLIKWLARGEKQLPAELRSLGLQIDALSQQVEYHILGNHLFANGKALVFAGAYLAGPAADLWLSKGLQILDAEIPEQFLDDGGHFELSPMYHATLLWDMCDLVNLAQCSELGVLSARLVQWQVVVERGLKWLESMLHPDGGIAFFNDAAFGIAPEYSQVLEYATALGITTPKPAELKATFNSASGYVAVAPADGVKAVLDVASVGPDYQPGHAHADTLSFELSVFGRRLVVNSGTSQYGEGAERQRQRSTCAHSTVEVDGQNSSEVWAGFRVARRARPVVEKFDIQPLLVSVQASHDGYRRLAERSIHRRSWTFTSNGLEIADEVSGSQSIAIARLHIHPDVQLSEVGRGVVAEMGPGEKVYIDFTGADQVRLVASTWHPEFGRSLKSQCIEAIFAKRSLITHIRWS